VENNKLHDMELVGLSVYVVCTFGTPE